MAYATAAQLASECKLSSSGFTTSTNPTLARVEEIIAEEEAVIDAMLANRYTVPVTTAQGIAILRSISLGICAARVRGLMSVKTADAKLAQEGDTSPLAIAKARLEALISGKMVLVDESEKTRPIAETITPEFDPECQQW